MGYAGGASLVAVALKQAAVRGPGRCRFCSRLSTKRTADRRVSSGDAKATMLRCDKLMMIALRFTAS